MAPLATPGYTYDWSLKIVSGIYVGVGGGHLAVAMLWFVVTRRLSLQRSAWINYVDSLEKQLAYLCNAHPRPPVLTVLLKHGRIKCPDRCCPPNVPPSFFGSCAFSFHSQGRSCWVMLFLGKFFWWWIVFLKIRKNFLPLFVRNGTLPSFPPLRAARS